MVKSHRYCCINFEVSEAFVMAIVLTCVSSLAEKNNCYKSCKGYSFVCNSYLFQFKPYKFVTCQMKIGQKFGVFNFLNDVLFFLVCLSFACRILNILPKNIRWKKIRGACRGACFCRFGVGEIFLNKSPGLIFSASTQFCLSFKFVKMASILRSYSENRQNNLFYVNLSNDRRCCFWNWNISKAGAFKPAGWIIGLFTLTPFYTKSKKEEIIQNIHLNLKSTGAQ